MRTRFKTAASAIAISTALVAQSAAGQSDTITFEIEPKAAAHALQEFAEQSGYQMAFLADSAAGVQTHGISGSFEPQAALHRLLEGTGLEYRLIDERTIAILEKTAGSGSESRSQRASLQFASSEVDQSSRRIAQVAEAEAQTVQQQAQAEAGDDGLELEEIVVTGSRIARSSFSAPAPMVTVDAEALSLNADPRIAATLNQLPALRATQTPTNTNFNEREAGTNFLDLRSLGIDRTLVLIDGRRQVGSRPGSAAVDTNTIPTALVERVDVITGGASAVYGADAVSGAINFIMKDDFEGLEIGGQIGIADEGDGETYQVSVTGGTNFNDERGNIYFNATFDKNEEIRAVNRDFSNKEIRFAPNPENTGPNDGIPDDILFENTFFVNTPAGGRVFTPDGSSRFEEFGGPFIFGFNNELVSQPLDTVVRFNSLCTGPSVDELLQRDPATASPLCASDNLSAFDQNLVPVERLIFAGGLTYELHEKVNFFARARFAQTQSSTSQQPSFFFPGSVEARIDVDNPFVPQELRDIVQAAGFDSFQVARTNVDQPPQASFADRDTFQAYIGLEGSLTSNLDYSVHYQIGQTDNTTEFQDRIVEEFLNQALDAVVDPETGDIVCRDPSGGCVPLNVLGIGASAAPGVGPHDFLRGPVPASEAVEFVRRDFLTEGHLEQEVVNLTLSGDTANILEPFAGPIGFAFGFEFRDEEARTEEGFLQTAGRLPNTPAIDNTVGSFDVWELFGEARLPILRGVPFAEELTVEGAARFSEYSTVDSTSAWELRGDWSPIQDIRLRATLAVAVRAPNIGELFGPVDVGGEFFNDPCDASNLDAGSQFRRQNCAALGLPEDFVSQSLNRTVNVLTGGNENLLEEEADTVTLGAVFTPRWVPGLSVSFDWWDIEIVDAINSFGAQQLVNSCVDSPTTDNIFCEQVTRAVDTGQIEQVRDQLINIAKFDAQGLDISASYSLDLGSVSDGGVPGTLDLNFVATYLDRLDFFASEETQVPVKEAGELGDPDFTWNLRATYKAGPFTISLEERFIGSTKFDLQESPERRSPNTTDSEWYTDIFVQYEVTPSVSTFVGIDNVTDNAIPIIARVPEIRSFTGDSNEFDKIGRFVRVGLRARF